MKTIFISGCSGVGKTAIAKKVLHQKSEFEKVITCTTRTPRPGETDGVDYYFLSVKNFEKEKKAGAFLEWAEVYGNYYGTRQSELERIKKAGHVPLIVNDIQGSLRFQKILPATERLLIFIKPKSLTQLKQQIIDRHQNMSATDLATRLKTAEKELVQAKKFDFQVVNRYGYLEETVTEIIKIIDENVFLT